MALHILKDTAALLTLKEQYSHYATVEVKPNTLLRRLMGQKAGVAVSSNCDRVRPVLQIVPPAWYGGEKDEWEHLRMCYRKTLQLAWQHQCDALVTPLLMAEDSRFPAGIDYKIAVDTIREFLADYPLEVYLLVFRKNVVARDGLRADVEQFLNRHYSYETLRWSARPFADAEDRFDTIMPGLSMPAAYDNESAAIQERDEYLDEVEACEDTFTLQADFWDELPQEAEHKAPTAAPERFVSRQRSSAEEAPPKAPNRRELPRKSRSADWSTGRLPNLDRYLQELDAGFSETLLKLIDRSGKKDSEIYNKANVSRQHFSKIRNNPNYKPTKSTAIAFAIALELNMEETNDLIGRAGYTLTRSSKFDMIIMYFIQNRNYNMFDINETLYEFDQSLLGT